MSNSFVKQQDDARSEGATTAPMTGPHPLRRRLLLGAAAIPSVYTLTSGAAVAAASSVSCFDATQTATPARVTTAPDQWARAQIKGGTAGAQPSSPKGYCLKDPVKQGECADPLHPDWSAAQTYWYVQGQRTLEAQGGMRNLTSTSSGYGLLYIDRTGTIQAFDPLAHPGVELKFASIACMNSLSPITKSALG
jgi:hypothetical protein